MGLFTRHGIIVVKRKSAFITSFFMSLATPEFSNSSAQEIAELAGQVRALTRDVRELREHLGHAYPGPDEVAVRNAIVQVERLTREIFGQVESIEETTDMEDATWRIVVVHVLDGGELEAMVGRFNDWHDRLSEVPAAVRGHFRLMQNPKE